MQSTIEVIRDIRKLCTHEFEGGHRCASPALRGEAFCSYHHPTRKPVSKPESCHRRARQAERIARQSFHFGLPTNLPEYQQALHQIMARLAANQIDVRRARLLLFTLKIAGKTIAP